MEGRRDVRRTTVYRKKMAFESIIDILQHLYDCITQHVLVHYEYICVWVNMCNRIWAARGIDCMPMKNLNLNCISLR